MTDSPDAPAATARPTDRLTATEWRVLTVTILASAMVFIDATVVNVALADLRDGLGADLGDLQWVVESYMLTLTAGLLAGGAAGDRWGRKAALLLGTALFALASVACGLAQDVATLTVARAAQGVGGAILVPASLAVITATFPKARRGRAIGLWSAGSALAVAAAPLLGGVLVTELSWRWIFFINLPVAAIIVALGLKSVAESRADPPPRVDLPGTILITLGLGLSIFGLIEGGRYGYGAAIAVGPILAGLLALGLFGLHQRRSPAPLIPFALFRSRAYAAATAITVGLYAALGTMTFFLPLHLITVWGWTAAEAGMAMLPFVIPLATLSGPVGGLADRVGPRPLLLVGSLTVALGWALLALAGDPARGWPAVVFPMATVGLGMSLSVAPLTTVVMNAAPPDRTGVASALNNAVSRLAMLVAIALSGGIALAAFTAALPPDLAAVLPAEELAKLAAATAPVGVPDAAEAIARAAGFAFTVLAVASAGIVLIGSAVPAASVPRKAGGGGAD